MKTLSQLKTAYCICFLLSMSISSSLFSQNNSMLFRAGGGGILEDNAWGGGIAYDIKMDSTPLILSLFYDRYGAKDNFGQGPGTLFISYLGAHILYAPSITGFYAGPGIGTSHRGGSRVQTRNSLFVDAVIGNKASISPRIGAYAELKYLWNQRSRPDTDDFNDGKFNGQRVFLFDNDITGIVGVFFILD